MKFIVESISKCSGRLGCLSKSDKKLQTPLLLLYTKSASVPHITKEVLDMIISSNDTDESILSNAIEISMESTLHMEEAIHAYKKGITPFAGFDPDRTLTMVTIKDTGELSPSGYHEKDLISTFTRRGKRTISSKRYMELMQSMKPDILHTLCDGDTNIDSSGKRIKKSIDRTESFFNECLEYYKLWTMDLSNRSMLFAPIAGGFNLSERERTIKHLLQFETDIDGYFLDGFHNNGETALSVNRMKLKEIISHCCNDLLPNDKPKMMLGGYNPLVLLEMIQCGIDIFDNSYVYLMTNKNYALTFNFNYNDNDHSNSTFHIDLSKSIYKDDFQPFMQNCNCLACKKHTRAYTNHLINTKELLAPVLLMIHNTHHYLAFFKMIRQSISDDSLSTLIDLIKSQMETIDDNLDNLDNFTNETVVMESSIEVNNSNIDGTDIEIKRIKLNTINNENNL